MVAWENFEAEQFSSGEMEKNKFVLKCFLGHFECFKQLFFLVVNWPILTPLPSPLLENSTIFLNLLFVSFGFIALFIRSVSPFSLGKKIYTLTVALGNTFKCLDNNAYILVWRLVEKYVAKEN